MTDVRRKMGPDTDFLLNFEPISGNFRSPIMMSWVEHIHRLKSDWGIGIEQVSTISEVPLERLVEALRRGDEELPMDLGGLRPILAIHTRLSEIYPDADDQLKWLSQPNEAFEGKTPTELMRQGSEEMNWIAYVLTSVAASKKIQAPEGEDV